VRKKNIEVLLERWTKAFASVIAASRRDADLTQTQVADEMGWERDVVSRIETGRRAVSNAEFIVLCKIMKVAPEALFARALRW
jgi:transcriptional regulator with XRE-family HTH domain